MLFHTFALRKGGATYQVHTTVPNDFLITKHKQRMMIEWFIGVVIGLAIGLTIGILLQKSKLVGRLQALEGEAAGLRRQMEGERSAAAKQVTQIREDASRQMRQLTDRDEALLANERNLHDREMETVRSAHAKQIASLESQIAEERRHATELREENNRQWAQRLDTLCEEMRKNAAEQLAAKQRSLQEDNRQQMDELLKPIKEQFADFKRTVEENRAQSELNKKDLQNTFESTMRLFQQQQQQAVASMKEQTARIGSDAANLTRALKGDSKQQGDWGEMVLATLWRIADCARTRSTLYKSRPKTARAEVSAPTSSFASQKVGAW